jgi:hypothetical protein
MSKLSLITIICASAITALSTFPVGTTNNNTPMGFVEIVEAEIEIEYISPKNFE